MIAAAIVVVVVVVDDVADLNVNVNLTPVFKAVKTPLFIFLITFTIVFVGIAVAYV